MQIVQYGHPVLRWKAKPIQSINDELRSVVSEMFELMYAANGIGLAANQVGLPLRFFIVNVTADPAEKDEEIVFLNPRIRRRKGAASGEEGCLSLPGLYANVERAEEIVVEAYDLEGEGFEMDLDELPARVVQHETDHLDGVLFVDRLAPDDRLKLEPRLLGFESDFRKQQATGQFLSDDEIKRQLKAMEKGLAAK
ncbi:MAG: peptide deformylase [Planctomycetota bacterium]|nr:MAG: peptide deformylase [Planctomycetota bacterium]GDY09862.1 peptide deformylase [Planctomycetia bacterium]